MFYRGPYQDSLLMNSNFKIFVAARPRLGVPSDDLQAQSKAGQQIAGHTSLGVRLTRFISRCGTSDLV